MLWAASTIAFMRVSEYVNICWCDVTCSEDCISIVLSTNQRLTLLGMAILFRFTKPILPYACLHKALIHYRIVVSNANTSPDAFIFQAGIFNPLSCVMITRVICQLLSKAGLNYMKFASHSFRIGATTTAAAAGLPAWMIKSLGCWSSNAYLFVYSSPTTFNFSHPPTASLYRYIQSSAMGPRHF